jgi:CBS domain-containing protein
MPTWTRSAAKAADLKEKLVPTLTDIMTIDVFTTTPDASVTEVAATMVHGRFGSAVVMRGSVVLGIFTERDVLRAAASGEDLNNTSISTWMTADPETAAPGLDVDEAAQMMLAGGFRHLPVLDGGALAGIVSLRDLLSARVKRRG